MKTLKSLVYGAGLLLIGAMGPVFAAVKYQPAYQFFEITTPNTAGFTGDISDNFIGNFMGVIPSGPFQGGQSEVQVATLPISPASGTLTIAVLCADGEAIGYYDLKFSYDSTIVGSDPAVAITTWVGNLIAPLTYCPQPSHVSISVMGSADKGYKIAINNVGSTTAPRKK